MSDLPEMPEDIKKQLEEAVSTKDAPDTFLENHNLMQLFPTPLFIGNLKESEMHVVDELEKTILELVEKKEGFFEAGNYTSDDLLHAPGRGFDKLSEIVLTEANTICDFLKIKRDGLYISGMWANVTNPNHRHPIHIHPNSLLSGILYIKTPPKCGKTAFTDPRPGARVFEPSYEQMHEFNSGLFQYPPARGQMLMWQSFLTHGVERGFCEDENDMRIVVAFNVMMVGKIETMTGKLELN